MNLHRACSPIFAIGLILIGIVSNAQAGSPQLPTLNGCYRSFDLRVVDRAPLPSQFCIERDEREDRHDDRGLPAIRVAWKFGTGEWSCESVSTFSFTAGAEEASLSINAAINEPKSDQTVALEIRGDDSRGGITTRLTDRSGSTHKPHVSTAQYFRLPEDSTARLAKAMAGCEERAR